VPVRPVSGDTLERRTLCYNFVPVQVGAGFQKGLKSMAHDKIAVVDFGGQYAHLIATKVRRLKVLAEILQPEDPAEKFAQYQGIILSGSPALASHGDDYGYDRAIYDLSIPILGFCYGHQEIAKHYGGQVEHCQREYGPRSSRFAGRALFSWGSLRKRRSG